VNWYVLYTAPKKEKVLSTLFQKNEIEHYLPLRVELRQWSDRKKKVEMVLFPSYIFVRIEKENFYDVLKFDGAVRFIHLEGKPAAVRDTDIEAIKRFLSLGIHFDIETDEIIAGKKVKIMGGPLIDLEGECVSDSNAEYFVIRIDAINQNLKVKIQKHLVKAI